MQIRTDSQGNLDEIIGKGNFHLEQMDDGHWWMRFENDSGQSVDVNLTARGKIKATFEKGLG